MSWELGEAFKETNDGHLYFIVVVKNNQRVAVSLATVKGDVSVDEACVLFPGEHSFVTRQTYVAYNRALVCTINKLEEMISSGEISRFDAAAPLELVKKILEKANNTRALLPRTRKLMEEQYLKFI